MMRNFFIIFFGFVFAIFCIWWWKGKVSEKLPPKTQEDQEYFLDKELEISSKSLETFKEKLLNSETLQKKRKLKKQNKSKDDELREMEDKALKEIIECDVQWGKVKQEWEKADLDERDQREPDELMLRNFIDLIRNTHCSFNQTNQYFMERRKKFMRLILEGKYEDAIELESRLREDRHTVLQYKTFKLIFNGLKRHELDTTLEQEIRKKILDVIDQNAQRPISTMELLTYDSLFHLLLETADWPEDLKNEVQQFAIGIKNFKDQLFSHQEEFSQAYPELEGLSEDLLVRSAQLEIFMKEIEETEQFRSRDLRSILEKLKTAEDRR